MTLINKFIVFYLFVSFGLFAADEEVKVTRYIVKLKPRGIETLGKQKGPRTHGKIIKQMQNGYVVSLPEGEDPGVLAGDEVEAVEKDQRVYLVEPKHSEPAYKNESEEVVPVGIKRIKGEICGEFAVSVAIIDTGIDLYHYDLRVVGGKNFVDPSKSPEDDHGHGTHVAGTVGARCNGKGVVGVVPGAKLYALKVLNQEGRGWLSDIIDAVDWVTEHADEIDVVNMSLGVVDHSELYHQAIQRSVKKGVVYVAAAGNDGQDIFSFTMDYYIGSNYLPAAYPEVMTISAMTDTDGRAGGKGEPVLINKPDGSVDVYEDDTFALFSNYSSTHHAENPVFSPGGGVDLAAPGVNILSTFPGNQLRLMSGTSMAAPHAAGAVARLIARYGRDFNGDGLRDEQDVYQIRQALIDSGQPQSQWNAAMDAKDPDSNHEPLLQVE